MFENGQRNSGRKILKNRLKTPFFINKFLHIIKKMFSKKITDT